MLDNGNKRDICSLQDSYLYAASFTEMNDPFECSLQVPIIESNNILLTHIIQQISTIGIYSLTIDKRNFPSNEIMWAHYANAHRGFCIEYDFDFLISSMKNTDYWQSVKVSYKNTPPQMVYTTYNNLLDEIIGTKSYNWNYENEVRLVFRQCGIKQYKSCTYPITGIYFGLNINENDRNSIIQSLADKKHIHFYQMGRKEDTYELTFMELDTNISYEIISISRQRFGDNIIVLYKSKNVDKISILQCIKSIRKTLKNPANITLINDIRVLEYINKLSEEPNKMELECLTKHWLAYSTFDAPNDALLYPMKKYI